LDWILVAGGTFLIFQSSKSLNINKIPIHESQKSWSKIQSNHPNPFLSLQNPNLEIPKILVKNPGQKSQSMNLKNPGHFWESRWQNRLIGWDLGAVSPPLAAYIDQWETLDAAVLVPGCGNAYEAEYLLKRGFTNVTVIDIAPSAVVCLRDRLDSDFPNWQKHLTLITGDFFEHRGRYDLILEQTFFCALDPSWRPTYAQHMHQLLKPGGKLAGVMFDRDFEGGPPYGGCATDYKTLFEGVFTVKILEPCHNSAGPRMGSEVFVVLEK